jgi:predicted CoA-binding protein
VSLDTLSQNEHPMIEWPKLQPWAVVGVSSSPEKYGYKIYKDLKNAGYTVYGINPKLTELDGDTIYPDLKSLPQKPSVVNLVVPPSATLAVIEECAQLGITRLWFQPGSESPEAVEKALVLGLEPLTDSCIMIQKI